MFTCGIASRHILSLLQTVQPTGMKYYPACGMSADIYILPLQNGAATGMKYYPASSIQPTYIVPAPNGAADRYEILPCLWHAADIYILRSKQCSRQVWNIIRF